MAKPRKVQEPAGAYVATHPRKAASSGVLVADLKAVQENNAKLMQVHRKVLQKLAQ